MKLNCLANGVCVSSSNNIFCSTCLKGNQSRLPFAQSEIKPKDLLELLHMDVCGPTEVKSFGGTRYFLTITDDYSRYTVVYFLREKSQVLEYFQKF